jgi:hypothetical protein
MDSATPTKSRRGSETRKKARMVTTRYDLEEFEQLQEAASRAGLTPASFQRVQSLAAPKTRSTRRAPVEREMLAKVLGQLGKVGGNINQIARHARLGFGVTSEVEEELAALRALRPLLMEALGRKP